MSSRSDLNDALPADTHHGYIKSKLLQEPGRLDDARMFNRRDDEMTATLARPHIITWKFETKTIK